MMAATILGGPHTWTSGIDDDGYRTYNVEWIVQVPTTDGPAVVMQCAGLPLPGTTWDFGGDEVDVWAWCRPMMDVSIHPDIKVGDPATLYIVKQTFSTKPPSRDQGQSAPAGGGSTKCAQAKIDDPLLQAPKVSGSSIRITEEAEVDRFGVWIRTSALERMRGKAVEFDKYYSSISIQMNVVPLNVGSTPWYVFVENEYRNHVNDQVLWGYPKRSVKLSEFRWERQYYGLCYVYYTWHFTFEVRTREKRSLDLINGHLGESVEFVSAWDRDVIDEGNLVLRGRYETDEKAIQYGQYILAPGVVPGSNRQSDYIQHLDMYSNAVPVILDGRGRPWDRANITTGTGDDNIGHRFIEYYDEANFLELGIPSAL